MSNDQIVYLNGKYLPISQAHVSVLDRGFIYGDGAQVDGKYVEGLQVSVYELDRQVKPAEVKKLKKEFAGLVESMIGNLDGASVTDALAPMELNGVPGYSGSLAAGSTCA